MLDGQCPMNYRFVHKSCYLFDVQPSENLCKISQHRERKEGGEGRARARRKVVRKFLSFLMNFEVDFIIFAFPVFRWQLRRSSVRTELQNGERGKGDCSWWWRS